MLDVPVVGVAKSGWGLDQFRDYAVASLKLNNMDPGTQAAKHMLAGHGRGGLDRRRPRDRRRGSCRAVRARHLGRGLDLAAAPW